MKNFSVLISNKINFYANNYNFYSSDKFIYIFCTKIPEFDLVAEFYSKNTNNIIKIPIQISSLKKEVPYSSFPFYTIPTITLYEHSVLNEWTLKIYSNCERNLLAKFNLKIKIDKNYINGKAYFSKEFFCGIFFEDIG